LPGTILIIDDHEDTRRIYGEILRFGDFQVLEAGDGTSGLERVRDSRPDLVILDVSLPVTSGYEVLSEIRADPHCQSTRVICVSANAFSHNVERAYALGCDLYLTKPLPPSDLLARVRSVLMGEIVRLGDADLSA
jgi:CheY-like chemotaxis protein